MAKAVSADPARESLKEIWHADYYSWSGTFERRGHGEHEGLCEEAFLVKHQLFRKRVRLEITITFKRSRADRERQIEHAFPHAWKQIRLERKRATGKKGEGRARRAGRERKHCRGRHHSETWFVLQPT